MSTSGEAEPRIEDYTLAMRIVATFFAFLGTGTNIMVVAISVRQFKKDAKAFVTLMQIHAFTNALGAFSGWIVTNRHVYVGDIVVFVSYGPGALFGRRFCAACDCIPTQITQMMPIMVAMMMVYRCLILFDVKFRKRTMVFSAFALYAITAPLFYATITGYVPWSEVLPRLVNETSLQREVNTTQAYGLTFTPLNLIIWPYYNKVSIPSLVVCFIVRIIMQVRMNRFAREMSQRTAKIHNGYMNLLTTDALVVLIFFIATSMDAVGQLSTLSPKIELLLNLYNYTIFNFPAVIQGCSLLYFVPYLNAPLRRVFTNEHSSTATVAVVSTTQPSHQGGTLKKENSHSVIQI